MKKHLLPILTTLFILGCAACTRTNPSGGDVSSSRRTRSSIDDGPSFSKLSTDSVNEGGSVSGSLIEIDIGNYLEPEASYTCSFVPSSYANTNIIVTLSDTNVAEIEMVTANSFKINTKNIGDSILKIYAEEDNFLLYRNVIQVRKAYSKEEIISVIYDKYDIWRSTGIYGNYNLTFVSDDPINGTLVGQDDMEYSYLNFTLEYVDTIKMYDFRFHSFKVTLDLENSSTSRTYTEVDVAVTGDNILFYYDEGLLEMFTPKI